MSSPTTKPASRPESANGPRSRGRLAMAVVLLITALALLTFRALPYLRPKPVLLKLDDDVKIEPAPAVPEGDKEPLRAALIKALDARRLADAQPGDPSAQLAYAQQAAQAMDLYGAREAFAKCLLLSPAPSASLFVALANCEGALGMHQEAAAHLQKAIHLAPDDAQAYILLSRIEGGLHDRSYMAGILDRASKALRPDDSEGRRQLAIEFETLQDPQRALVEIQHARQVSPKDRGLMEVEASLLLKVRRLEDARKAAEETARAYPDSSSAHLILASYYTTPGNPNRNLQLAEHHFWEALNRDHNDFEACDRLGRLYVEMQKPRQAAYIFRWLTVLQPASGSARMQLSEALAALGTKTEAGEQRSEAIRLLAGERREKELRIVRNKRPLDPAARTELGKQYLAMGRCRDALVELEAANTLARGSAATRADLLNLFKTVGVDPPGYLTATAHAGSSQ